MEIGSPFQRSVMALPESSASSETSISQPRLHRSLIEPLTNLHENNYLLPAKLGWMMKGTKAFITTIKTTDILSSRSQVSTRLFYVHGSYSWVNTTEPTISVPGGPKIFKPVDQNGHSLTPPTEDKPRKYVNENASRMPISHFEPMFRALIAANHLYNYNNVDLVADSETLHMLYLLCKGDDDTKRFRIDANIIGTTMFLTLCEKRGKAIFKDDEAAGAGLVFPAKLLEIPKDLQDSTSSWRVLQYDLGRLRCIVRSEVDATYSDHNCEPNTNMPVFGHLIRVSDSSDVSPRINKSLSVVACGRPISPSDTARVLTNYRTDALGELLPQLYFDRTRWLVDVTQRIDNVGAHMVIKVTDLAKNYQSWQLEHQDSLRKLVTLLSTIRRFAKDNNGRCAGICEHHRFPPKLHLFSSRITHDLLPEDIIEKFWPEGLSNDLPGSSHRPNSDEDTSCFLDSPQISSRVARLSAAIRKAEEERVKSERQNGDAEHKTANPCEMDEELDDDSPIASVFGKNNVSEKRTRNGVPFIDYENTEDMEDSEGDAGLDDDEIEYSEQEEVELVIRDSEEESPSSLSEEETASPVQPVRGRGRALWV